MTNKDLQVLLSEFDDNAEVKIVILENNIVQEVHTLESLQVSLSAYGLMLGIEKE